MFLCGINSFQNRNTFSHNFTLIINDSRLFNSNLNIAITVNIARFLKTAFFYRTPLVTASELKSNISIASLDKNEKKLFLYIDTSHANQTNNNINKNLKKTDKKKRCFKHI